MSGPALESGAGSAPLRGPLAEYIGLTVTLAVLVFIFGVSSPHFLSSTTFLTIANQTPDAVVIAVGMTFVLIIGGIDLSVGSVLALSSAVLGVGLTQWHWPLGAALVASGLTGLACGLANGATTLRFSLPSFIVTLGMLEIARGGAYLVTNSQTKYLGSRVQGLTDYGIGGLSLAFLFTITLVVAAQVVLTRTRFGRYIIAIGANEEATRLSGVRTRPVKLAVFALSGLCAGLAAIISTSRLGSADPNAGTGFELQAIAAVVIGGTSLMGGRGSVVRSFFGVLIIAVLGNGLAQIGVGEPTKRVVTGCVIVAAVISDYYRNRLTRNRV